MNDLELKTGRGIILWILITIACMIFIVANNNKSHIFQFGPNEELVIVGICIDSYDKYFFVVSFCFINSGIRVLNINVLHPWIINIVQDIKNIDYVDEFKSYELSYIHAIYNWFDFFMYMNILMSQIDMLIVEVMADLIITTILTKYYLSTKKKKYDGYDILLDEYVV